MIEEQIKQEAKDFCDNIGESYVRYNGDGSDFDLIDHTVKFTQSLIDKGMLAGMSEVNKRDDHYKLTIELMSKRIKELEEEEVRQHRENAFQPATPVNVITDEAIQEATEIECMTNSHSPYSCGIAMVKWYKQQLTK